MKTNSTRFLTFGLLLFLVATASGQASTAQVVLDKFLKLDFDGARLDSNGMKRVFPLTDWKDMPGYDSSIIVRGYKAGHRRSAADGRRAWSPMTWWE